MSLFGYLNLGNPKLIAENESQEMKNCRIDQGYLEYASFPVNEWNNRRIYMPNGKILKLADEKKGEVTWQDNESSTPYNPGINPPDDIVTSKDPLTTVSKLPTKAMTAYGSNPYAPGDYEWGITLYDPDTGEESRPYLFTGTVGTNQVLRLTNFPDLSSYFPQRTSLEWRIYRRPIGGSELLLVNTSTTIGATSVYAGPFDDEVADEDLGAANDTASDYAVLNVTDAVQSVAMFNDHLFIGGASAEGEGSKVLFSRQGKWWAFPRENQLNIEGGKHGYDFKGFCIVDERLVMFGTDAAYVLYGDNADNFAMKRVNFSLSDSNEENWFCQNTQKEVNGLVLFSVDGYSNEDIDGVSTQVVKEQFIAAIDGVRAKVISDKIKNHGVLLNKGQLIETSVIDNRYYCIKYIDLDATEAALTEAGRTMASATTADYVYTTLVLDAYSMGWSMANDSGQFTYRTKEFALPRQVQFHKRIWVEAEGEFTLQFLGDGNLVTSLTFNLSSKQKQYMNIRPYRYDAFSFRFIGESGCKIYDFGVDV